MHVPTVLSALEPRNLGELKQVTTVLGKLERTLTGPFGVVK